MSAVGRGPLCQSWRERYLSTLGGSVKDRDNKASRWVKTLILSCWDYIEAIWSGRNAVVHGNDNRGTFEKELASLCHHAKEYYQLFTKDRHVVPSSRSYLFDKPLLAVQQQTRDNLVGWLASVREALQTCEAREARSNS
jgi:hypothetical protein